MNVKRYFKFHFVLIFTIILIFSCLPIWYFDYYVNQDGSPHLYNSYLLLELLKGNTTFTNIYSVNPYPIPNISGHWILSFLLLFFPPFVVTKIMVTLTFGGLVAACGWLRWQTVGREGLNISFLFGAVFAFNWLWFLGFYNFILGLIGFTFTLGLFWKWREKLNLLKSIILAFLIAIVFYSHLISFGMLFGSILIISLFSVTEHRKRNYLLTVAAFLPSIPLIIGYKLSTESGGTIFPRWSYLKNPFSISDWIMQLQAADPLQLISRRALPFSSAESGMFALFSAFFGIFLLIFLISVGTWIYRNQINFNYKEKFPWLILFGLSVIFWIFAPDDFGKSHGGFLRERVLLCGLVCFIPIYEISKIKWLKIISPIILSGLIIFQTSVLWEYSISANRIAADYLSAKPYISNTDNLASIVLIENSCRYKPSPLSNLNPLLGIGKETRIWDNYELSYYNFPIIVKDRNEQQFIFDFREENAIDICNPSINVGEKLARLQALFDLHHQKFSVILVWNGDERLDPIISKWFEVEPFFQNGKVKLYHHK